MLNHDTALPDNEAIHHQQKRNKFLSLFPSNDTKWKTKNTFYKSPTVASYSTMTSSSSSSSTMCPMPTMTKPLFKITENSSKADYAMLRKFFSKFQSKSRQRSEILKQHLLPWLRRNFVQFRIQLDEEEIGGWGSKEKKELQFGRSVLLKWWRLLLSSMVLIENEERCVYYESILEIISRCEFLDFDYTGPFDYTQWSQTDHSSNLIDEYRQLLNSTLKYAIDRLNQKAVFSNMISFCAKILALCYFKIPGLASSLLQALKIRPFIMKKLQVEMTNKSLNIAEKYRDNLKLIFPPYLHQLMAPDIVSYKQYFADIKNIKSPVLLSGNWIRRWRSDDSELFFSFYRHYHSTLKSYISTIQPDIQALYQRNAALLISPGYMYFASFFAGKIDSLINREIHSVTTVIDQTQIKKNCFLSSTIAPVDNISMIDETSPFMGGFTTAKAYSNTPTGKPKALEMATRRYAECMTWCIVAADPGGLYHDMINVWIRFAMKRTVLTEAEGVYCLLDFIEQTILELQKFPLKRNYFPIDLPFILHGLDIILSQSDHSISLLRALSFIYVHFGFLTSHAALLDLLCNGILLNTMVFERLLLHWGKNVRIFFLRCLMWRVGRVWHANGVRWNSEAEQMVKMMVRESQDAAMCDGYSCLGLWKCQEEDEGVSSEIKAYRKCSLEIHMVLEALMASFHRNHTYFQQSFADLPNREKLMVSNTPQSRNTLFLSHLAVPSIDCQTYVINENIYPTNNYHKRSKPLPKKRHIITRSRKGRLLKLFNSHVNLPIQENECLVNEVDTFHEFYTVSGNYTVSSITDCLQYSVCEVPQLSQEPMMLIKAKDWKYQGSHHVYAIKLLSEMKAIMHEYCVWLEKMQASRSNANMVFVPRLSLDWPKNWTFSHS